MKVKLLKDIESGGVIAQSPRRKATFKQQRQPDGTYVEVPERVGAEPFLWVAGAVVEMSDASAQKYIERGLAEPLVEVSADA